MARACPTRLVTPRFHGYCNAFRYDLDRRKGRSSVGLGMNVAKSFAEIERPSACLAVRRRPWLAL